MRLWPAPPLPGRQYQSFGRVLPSRQEDKRRSLIRGRCPQLLIVKPFRLKCRLPLVEQLRIVISVLINRSEKHAARVRFPCLSRLMWHRFLFARTCRCNCIYMYMQLHLHVRANSPPYQLGHPEPMNRALRAVGRGTTTECGCPRRSFSGLRHYFLACGFLFSIKCRTFVAVLV